MLPKMTGAQLSNTRIEFSILKLNIKFGNAFYLTQRSVYYNKFMLKAMEVV